MIEFRHVGKTYPGGSEAVKDFSLSVPTGSITVLVGSSGCGKTTLLRMVNRMVEPTQGAVLIDGEDVRNQDPVSLRRRVGYVMQSGGLLPHRTVSQNIQTVMRLTGASRQASEARARELMELVGLNSALAQRYPAELSGGQQQRVGVARALAVDPNILLMDEPFGAVDPLVRRDLQRELIDLQTRMNKTVVFVTHDIDEAFLLGDQVAILRQGAELAQVGSPAAIASSPADDFVRDFIGHTAWDTPLHPRVEGDRTILVDSDGRVRGRLEEK